jgi:predicted helicase
MTARVHYADLWGVREVYEEDEHGERVLTGGKYDWLWRHDVSATAWTTLEPQSPFYFFVPQDVDLRAEYEQGWIISEMIPIHGVGMTTARDHVVIDFEEKTILERARLFRDSTDTDEELCRKLKIPMKKGWNIARSRKLIKDTENLQHCINPVLYRPFDKRLIFYHDSLVWRTVKQVMQHILAGNNLALIATRQTKDEWHVLATDLIIGHKALAAYDINTLFPLYLYSKNVKASLFNIDEPTDAPGGRRPNLAPEFVEDFSERLKMTFIADGKGDCVETFGPEDVFDYMYAVFHSPTYRTRYAEFLKIDFPRLPLTSDPELFRSLCALGSELVGLHLMERRAPPVASFPVKGDNIVEAVRYTGTGDGADKGRVWINKEQYFENVPEEVWSFHVGGYQVCQKWLKDRKGRTLAYDDLTHYQQIVSALSETIRLMALIDDTIEQHGGWPLGDK